MHNFDPPFAHNDVKPGNVLITHRKGQAPLAILMDFGSARPGRRQIQSRAEALQLQVLFLFLQSSPAFFFNHFSLYYLFILFYLIRRLLVLAVTIIRCSHLEYLTLI